MSETVTVKTVTGPNDRGWYKVGLDDGREVETKNDEIVQAARTAAASGVSIEATINTQEKGKFTNHYLNGLGDISDERPKRTNGSATTQKTSGDSGRSNATQKVIETEWAFGRAVELLMASGEEFTLPLDTKVKSNLEATAAYLLEQIRK